MQERQLIMAALFLAVTGCDRNEPAVGRRMAAVEADVGAGDNVEPGSFGAEPGFVGARILPDANDLDGDGSPADVDPDDLDSDVFPGAPEIECDDIDQDGDGSDSCQVEVDADGDGVRAADDCDDLDARVHPLAFDERCNGIDENCDGHDDCDRDGDGALDAVDPDPDDPDVVPVSDEEPVARPM